MLIRIVAGLAVALALQNPNSLTPEERARMDAQNAELKAMLQPQARLPFTPQPVAIQRPATEGWELGMVSWIAADPQGRIYLLQRGDKADPVIVLDASGKILHSWGKGMFATPHAIRIDPQGNVWTTDAASSKVYKFSPEGKTLLLIEVGGQPTPCGNFCSTTDVAFARDGHIFVADGYRNARILEYSADGKKIAEWGSAGTGPGQFRLPHSIQIDGNDIVYVADRENGRIQRFTREGKFLGQWTQYGKTFGMTIAGNDMWLSTIPRGPNAAPGWLINVDRRSGDMFGFVESQGNHGVGVMPNGDLLQAPGPDQTPQIYRRAR